MIEIRKTFLQEEYYSIAKNKYSFRLGSWSKYWFFSAIRYSTQWLKYFDGTVKYLVGVCYDSARDVDRRFLAEKLGYLCKALKLEVRFGRNTPHVMRLLENEVILRHACSWNCAGTAMWWMVYSIVFSFRREIGFHTKAGVCKKMSFYGIRGQSKTLIFFYFNDLLW